MRKSITILLALLVVTPYFTAFVNSSVSASATTDQNSETTENDKPVGHADAEKTFPMLKNPSSVEVLQINLIESVRIQENGTSELELLIEIPSSLLADMYRRSLGVPLDVRVEDELSGSKPISVSTEETSENVPEILIPATIEEFHKSIEQQQQISLGIITEVFDSKIVPRTSSNGVRISINGRALLPAIDVTPIDSDFKWEITIGPRDNGVRSIFATLELVQLMLSSLPSEQLYECLWTTKIFLPRDAQLMNSHIIDGLNWRMDFGGGTSMNAWVSLEGVSTIVLKEKTLVTEQKITVTPQHLGGTSTDYKVFNISILSSNPPLNYSENVGVAWDYTWSTTWSDSQSLPFSYGPLDALLTVSASVTLSGYVGWEFDLLSGLTSFESWMSLDASVDVDFEATATVDYDHTWEETLFEWSTTFYFVYFALPVWADLQIAATGVLSVSAYGELTITAGASASASFTAGVRWTSAAGWEGIFDVSTSASYYGPTIDAEAGVWVRPSVRFRIAFLFFSVAGPYVEFEPYTILTLTCSYPPPHGEWSLAVYLRITGGVTFAGWLKGLLGLDDWSIALTQPDILIMSWSGSWGPTSMSITETLNPATTQTSTQVQVYGTATLSDGAPVSHANVIVTITQTGASWTTTTDSNGDYSAYISAPETAGTYTVQVSVSTGSLSDSTSKTLNVQDIPDVGANYQLHRTTTCKDVQPVSPWDPIDETHAFRRDDYIAYTWVHLTDVYIGLNVLFKWYKPDGNWYANYVYPTDAPPAGQYWLWYKCSAGIYIDGYAPADIEGRWRCEVSIDEGGGYELVAIEEFVIRYEIISAYRTMAKDVQGGVESPTYPYEPIDPTDEFLNTDPRALGWIRLDELAESVEVKWEWRDPLGQIEYTFFYTSLDPADEGYLYYTWYKFWGWIDIYGTSRQSKIGTWELRTYIKDVYGNWDLEYSEYFTISDNTEPGAPGTPVDDGDYSTTGTVTWTWTEAPEDWVVAKYRIQVGTTLGGNDVFDGYVGTSLTITLSDLPSGPTYYARVRAMNTVGQWGSWSPNSNGITVDIPPMVLIIEGPNGTIGYEDVLFRWKGSDDITPAHDLEYNYALYTQLEPPTWSGWLPDTSVQYNDLQNNDYIFEVKVRDQRHSEDQTPENRLFTVLVECEVTFYTDPTDPGYYISFEGQDYTNGDVDMFPYGTSGTISAIAPVGWVFDHWVTSGNVEIVDDILAITCGGTVTAVFAQAWVPYVPTAEQTEIEITTEAGTTYATVTLTFPDDGYRVTDWGSVSGTGNEFSADAKVERWTGISNPVITTLSNPYELGSLDDGNYLFTFKAWGTLVKEVSFTIGPPIQEGYLVVRGLDDGIYYRVYDSPLDSWGPWMRLPGATCDSPAAVVYQNKLHVVVRGLGGKTLWYGYVDLATDIFYGWTWLHGSTPSAPTLTSNGSALCLVVRGWDNRIYYGCYTGSLASWHVVPSGATCDSPAAALLGSDLHIVVRGMDGNSLWHTKVRCDGTGFSGWTRISGSTHSRPALTASQSTSEMYLVVRGLDNRIYYREYDASTDSWGPWEVVPTGATCDGPGATVIDNKLHISVRGIYGNSLWHGYIDLETEAFSDWTWISGATPSAPTLTPFVSEYELLLFFDDGVEDFGFVAIPGLIAAVKFSVSTESRITKLRFYVWGETKEVRIHILDSSFNSLYSPVVSPDSSTQHWFEVDISNENIFIEGDFYVGWQWITESPSGPWLGVDNTLPHHERSYLGIEGSPGSPIADEDYMIRVTVVQNY